MKKEKIHYKVMVHHINLACGIWPYKMPHQKEDMPWTKDKSKVTCKNCKKTLPYRIDNFNLDILVDIIVNGAKKYTLR